MKKSFFALFLLMVCASGQAQTTIIEYLQDTVSSPASDGRIRIEAAPAINALVGHAKATPATTFDTNANANSIFGGDESVVADANGNVEVSGYRVLVFLGKNSQTARSEAQNRQRSVKQQFPGIATYLNYNAPNFKVTVGDFLTYDEAEEFKEKLAKAFRFGREAFIVPAKIKYRVQK
ncbi:hypothetical protein SAMD00024442_35_26 [Candidatus Symbiothrix dinenymphae]|nr:hypothetical protein SAMD00024442_35_26 [Candidatus Symbiothrix dinenymphae]